LATFGASKNLKSQQILLKTHREYGGTRKNPTISLVYGTNIEPNLTEAEPRKLKRPEL